MIPKITSKRGCVDVSFHGVNLINANCSWFYNYKPINDRNIPNDISTFVPMIKNELYLKKAIDTNTLPVNPLYLLSANEPDMKNGLNEIPLNDMLILHQKIEQLCNPINLGSPAMTRQYGFEYLTKFLEGNDSYKPRVDFIVIHWYNFNANEFIKYVDLYYTTFN